MEQTLPSDALCLNLKRRKSAGIFHSLMVLLVLHVMASIVGVSATSTGVVQDKAAKEKVDYVYDLTLDASFDSIEANWKLQNPSGEVTDFGVTWWGSEGDHNKCEIPMNDEGTGAVNTDQCPDGAVLQPCAEYTIFVRPLNSEGEPSGRVAMQTVYTEPRGPPPSPVISGSVVTSEVITIEWTAPEFECNIASYQIYWEMYSLSSNEKTHGFDSHTSSTLRYTLNGIRAHSVYIICVAALVEEDLLGSAACVPLRTDLETPSAPLDLAVVVATNSTLTVQWQQPLNHTGVITEYVIKWFPKTGAEPSAHAGVSTAVIKNNGNDRNEFLIIGLAANQEYNVSVQAKQKGVDPGPEATALFTTMRNERVTPNEADDLVSDGMDSHTIVLYCLVAPTIIVLVFGLIITICKLRNPMKKEETMKHNKEGSRSYQRVLYQAVAVFPPAYTDNDEGTE